MASSYKRVYVRKFCERCGKEEFEGFVFGRWTTVHLRAQPNTHTMLCDQCPQELPAEPDVMAQLDFLFAN